MELQPGTPVQWESQSGGYYKQKKGTVIAFIPPEENAEKYLSSGTLRSHIKFQKCSSIPRVLVNHERSQFGYRDLLCAQGTMIEEIQSV